jgi:quaternary ammonium compound-resistance protein SugE
MAWLNLLIAGLFEISWAVGMKYTNGFSKTGPTILVVIAMLLSLYFLNQAIKTIPLGTAYAVWTGIGIAGTALLGMILFDEPVKLVRIFFISLIMISIIGLKVVTK